MERLSEDIRQLGFSVWSDRQELQPGTRRWKKAIEAAIEQASHVLVLLTPNAKASEWVSLEVSYARALDRTLVPWLVEGDARTAVSIELIGTQWIDAREDHASALAELPPHGYTSQASNSQPRLDRKRTLMADTSRILQISLVSSMMAFGGNAPDGRRANIEQTLGGSRGRRGVGAWPSVTAGKAVADPVGDDRTTVRKR
ncbi:MAG: toll/interleukin-1 receptor domain-containing protein [Acidobacteria bacterium]|nr:toll/interleukin-1 receptor domain-containing protein [Acidobacteriota bacterium]